MSALLVFSTFPDIATARQIGTELVSRQLAACVNLLPSVESIYRWENEVKSEPEVLAILKTTPDAYPAFESALKNLHPYEVPEILAFDPAKGFPPYLIWLAENVSPPQE